MTRDEYRDEYLRSDHWRETRKGALERAEHRCQVCNGKQSLDVHHRTYERLGEERDADLTVLCRSCHDLFHGSSRVARSRPAKGLLSTRSVHNIEQALAGTDPNHLWRLTRDYLKANPWSTARQVAEMGFLLQPDEGPLFLPARVSMYADWAYRVLAAACEDGFVQRRDVQEGKRKRVQWAVTDKAQRAPLTNNALLEVMSGLGPAHITAIAKAGGWKVNKVTGHLGALKLGKRVQKHRHHWSLTAAEELATMKRRAA